MTAPRTGADPDGEVQYGGFVTRTIAFAIDAALIDLAALIVAAVVTLVFSLFPVSDDVHQAAVIAGGVLFVIWTVTYFVIFWTTTGESPGYRAMTLKLIRSDGSRLRPRHALVRLFGMLVSFPLLWGYLPILVNNRRRGVHDRLAGTVVVTRSADAPPPDEARRLDRRVELDLGAADRGAHSAVAR
jgi:uncharacterized RDD family membrane protein YckC